jgi:capsid assembly protease
MRAWHKIVGEPWAMTESALETLLEVASRVNDPPEAIATRLGRELKHTQTVTQRGSIAIVPVVGPLFRYANLFTQISGATSYELLAKDFTVALEDPAITGIILNIDSPGGEVNGCSELSNLMFDARGKKPITAYVSGDAASGAYWIASSADTIVISPTSGLGSIGVVAVYQGQKEDAKTIEIVSSQSPYKRLKADSEEGRSKIQTRIDALAHVFVETVARNRCTDGETVMTQFGQGDILIGNQAVQAGLADHIGSFEGVIAHMMTLSHPPLTLSSLSEKDVSMNFEIFATDYPDLLKEIQNQASLSERQRIQAILLSEEAQGRTLLASHLAFETDLVPSAVLPLLSKASKEAEKPSGTSFEVFMGALGNPQISPSVAEEDDPEALAKRLASYRL